MLVDRRREKLLDSIIYFSNNTQMCGKTKLLKLLFLLDFDHFRQTGRSVTGMKYYAWRMGPVATALYEEIDHPEPDFLEAVRIERIQVIDHEREQIVPMRTFDPTHFSRREMRLLEEISARYREQSAGEMVEMVHAEQGAWDKVYQEGSGRGSEIPYTLALEGDPDRDIVLEKEKESREVRENLS